MKKQKQLLMNSLGMINIGRVSMNNLFLTGKIGIGKSIIINKVIKKVDCSIGGYITERQVENNIETFTAKVYKILDSIWGAKIL